jgi:hypothetical protein
MSKVYTEEVELPGEFMCSHYKRLCNMHIAENKNCIESGGDDICNMTILLNGQDLSFLDFRVCKECIGIHEDDNSFLLERGAINQLNRLIKFYSNIYGTIMFIGICNDNITIADYDTDYYPLVFEDKYGERHYIHIPLADWENDIKNRK